MQKRRSIITRVILTRITLAILSIATGWLSSTAGAADNPDIGPLIYGEALHSYYLGDDYDSMNRLLTAKKRNLLNSQSEHADLLLGSLYINYGLPQDADRLFSELIDREILPKTRAQTWFKKAGLHYRAGNNERALAILKQDVDGLPEQLEYDRRVMLANLLIQEGQYQAALTHLQKVPISSIQGAYARYNAGVALSRLDQPDIATDLLFEVIDLPPQSTEINALKDRAAMALGYLLLRHKDYLQAKAVFRTVRLEGPFSNAALLGLGWGHYYNGELEKAVVAWRTLSRRDPTDRAVQEALVALPNAYEQLKALQQALDHYRNAVGVFKSELKHIDATANQIRSDQWTDDLLQARAMAELEQPMAEIPKFTPKAGSDSVYLYKLFASHKFNKAYYSFTELRRLRSLLDRWQRQIPIFTGTLQHHENQYRHKLERYQSGIEQANARHQKLYKEYQILGQTMREAIRSKSGRALATPRQRHQWQRIQLLEQQLNELPQTPRTTALEERLRRVRGVLMWDMTQAMPQRSLTGLRELKQVGQYLDSTKQHLDALGQIKLDTHSRFDGALNENVQELEGKLTKLRSEVDKQLEIYKVHMEQLALDVLAENRAQVRTLLADAHFAVTRLQDKAATQNRGHL